MSTISEHSTPLLHVDEKHMLRSIQIAKNGLGFTAPNPMVGCVIVHEGNIIGEGFTSPYGGSHAEVNAINAIADVSKLEKSTLYVTLEPCSHFGKTPPCADFIIKHKIPKVVIGLKDPHKKVAGKGIEKLKNAGCTVKVGVAKEACREHHKRFLTYQIKKRPFIILKWAETQDGFIAPEHNQRNENPEPYWITNPFSRQLVHQWRSEEQGILAGTNTILADNPKLDVRDWTGKSPVRIVLDAKGKLSKKFHVMDGSQPTMVFTSLENPKGDMDGIEYRTIDYKKDMAFQICEELYRSNMQSIIIEGGAQTLQTFIDAGLWDEARIFKGPSIFKNGVGAPKISGSTVYSRYIREDQLTVLKND
ncbi:bifunctional diaminohydroxyphosphoribosylaminopyrimidine deaminase/5-amino-6-(5-phosphoribosylamino)uracil reductase RibD [Maribacter sp. 2304DJ31-5]|uniref:bifunctional diaminohydroxyphosphoribosylaminopyrimidine deaminase/5-amino-6-(5-phosphoribosylamino)uracil reductase RibD n=1 Tax=Maribacter sp. 2304DJ31-5 TaxID=3386273 RepID=UPI0039BC33DC